MKITLDIAILVDDLLVSLSDDALNHKDIQDQLDKEWSSILLDNLLTVENAVRSELLKRGYKI